MKYKHALIVSSAAALIVLFLIVWWWQADFSSDRLCKSRWSMRTVAPTFCQHDLDPNLEY